MRKLTTNGFFICFTGVDGSGKTTQAKKLVDNLSKYNLKFEYVYARFNPFLFKPFLLVGNFIFLRDKKVENYNQRTYEKKKVLKKYSLLSNLFYKILLIDYYIQLLYKIKLPLVFGKNIICDRYVYDTIVTDLSVDQEYSPEKIANRIEKLLSTLPEPKITFLMDVEEEIAYNRKDDIFSSDYVKDRRHNYLLIGEKYSMIQIDASDDINSVEKKILNYTKKYIGII